MSASDRPPFELGSCFRESFIARIDPEVREAVRLFGRLLDDLLLERSLAERGARADFELELRATVPELTTHARTLETIGAEAVAHPLSARDLKLGETAREVGAVILSAVTKFAAGLGEDGAPPPPHPERRKSDPPRRHLRPVPKPPGDEG